MADSLARFLFRQRMVSSSTGDSPALLMLGRELRSKLDLVREPTPSRSDAIPKQEFAVGEPVSVRDHRSNRPKRIQGRVERNCGSRVFEVSVPHGKWKRHYEQIRKSTEKVSQEGLGDEDLPSTSMSSFQGLKTPRLLKHRQISRI